MADSAYDSLIAALEGCGNNCLCSSIAKLLTDAGFTVREAGGPGHRVYSHTGLKGFFGGNYNCGHGRDPKVSALYVKKIIKTLRQIETELRAFLEHKK